MRIPARHKHMGRSVAGKPPAKGKTRQSTHAKNINKNNNKSISGSGDRGPDTARSSVSRGPTRPSAKHAMWGKPGAMTAKQTGQAIILNYAYVAGSFGVISILAGAVLEGDKSVTKTFLGSGPGLFFILRGVTSLCTTVVGCGLRGYWALSDFEGSSKLKTYAALLAADWVWGLLVIVAAGVCMHDSFFWWVGIVGDSVFQLGVLRTLTDLISMAGHHKRRKENGELEEQWGDGGGRVGGRVSPRLDGERGSSGGGFKGGEEEEEEEEERQQQQDVELGRAGAAASTVDAQEVAPSAPPLDTAFITTVIADEVDGVPTAPSSPIVRDHAMPLPASQLTLSQHDFEEKWLRLRQLSSSTQSCRVVPAMADVNMHLQERGFSVVASGTVEGLTRVYLYRGLDDGETSFLLCELLMAPGVDASAPCTVTLTIKVDGSEGSPSIGGAVDALDLKMLLHS
jgi:hypothetical protein